MALPWLSIVARTVPWAELVRRAPQIISATSEILEKRSSAAGKRAVVPPDEADEIDLERRITNLEDRDAEHAELFQQLAKQTQDMSVGLQVLAARLRLLTWVVTIALLAGILALVFLG